MKTLYIIFRAGDVRFASFVGHIATLVDFDNIGSCEFWRSASKLGCASLTATPEWVDQVAKTAKIFGAFSVSLTAPGATKK